MAKSRIYDLISQINAILGKPLSQILSGLSPKYYARILQQREALLQVRSQLERALAQNQEVPADVADSYQQRIIELETAMEKPITSLLNEIQPKLTLPNPDQNTEAQDPKSTAEVEPKSATREVGGIERVEAPNNLIERLSEKYSEELVERLAERVYNRLLAVVTQEQRSQLCEEIDTLQTTKQNLSQEVALLNDLRTQKLQDFNLQQQQHQDAYADSVEFLNQFLHEGIRQPLQSATAQMDLLKSDAEKVNQAIAQISIKQILEPINSQLNTQSQSFLEEFIARLNALFAKTLPTLAEQIKTLRQEVDLNLESYQGKFENHSESMAATLADSQAQIIQISNQWQSTINEIEIKNQAIAIQKEEQTSLIQIFPRLSEIEANLLGVTAISSQGLDQAQNLEQGMVQILSQIQTQMQTQQSDTFNALAEIQALVEELSLRSLRIESSTDQKLEDLRESLLNIQKSRSDSLALEHQRINLAIDGISENIDKIQREIPAQVVIPKTSSIESPLDISLEQIEFSYPELDLITESSPFPEIDQQRVEIVSNCGQEITPEISSEISPEIELDHNQYASVEVTQDNKQEIPQRLEIAQPLDKLTVLAVEIDRTLPIQTESRLESSYSTTSIDLNLLLEELEIPIISSSFNARKISEASVELDLENNDSVDFDFSSLNFFADSEEPNTEANPQIASEISVKVEPEIEPEISEIYTGSVPDLKIEILEAEIDLSLEQDLTPNLNLFNELNHELSQKVSLDLRGDLSEHTSLDLTNNIKIGANNQPPDHEVKVKAQINEKWILGIDFDGTVLQGWLYELNSTRQIELLPIEAIAEVLNPQDYSAPTILIKNFKPFLQVALPYLVDDTWQPKIQWKRSLNLSLQSLIGGCQDLFRQLEIPKAIRPNIENVVLAHPSAWSDIYSLNMREAILAAELVSRPEQVIMIDQAIAPILTMIEENSIQYPALLIDANNDSLCFCLVGSANQRNGNIPAIATSSYDYAGFGIAQDILTQLIYSRWRNAKNQNRDACNLNLISLPNLAMSDRLKRIVLRQTLEETTAGQELWQAANQIMEQLSLTENDEFEINIMDYLIVISRREIENQVLQLFIQRIGHELNALMLRAVGSANEIQQILLSGSYTKFPSLQKWLNQKFNQAEIRQLSDHSIAKGLAIAPLFTPMLDLSRQQYSDYFILSEISCLSTKSSYTSQSLLRQLRNQGINTNACEQRILQILNGEVSLQLFPWQELENKILITESLLHRELAQGRLFEVSTDGTYQPNPLQFRLLQAYLELISGYLRQSLAEPLVLSLQSTISN
jgi:hypothetical protein